MKLDLDCSQEALHAVCECMYRKEITVDSELIADMLTGADFLQVSDSLRSAILKQEPAGQSIRGRHFRLAFQMTQKFDHVNC